MMKICKECNVEKDEIEFSIKNKKNNTLNSKCKNCEKTYQKEYKLKNKNAIKEQDKKYRQENKIKIAEQKRIYRLNNKEEISSYQKIYIENNKNNKKIYDEKRYIENIDQITQHKKEYYKNNRIKILSNRNKENCNKYRKEKLKNDPFFKLRAGVSRAIAYCLKSNHSSKNESSCLNYLPYTIEELKIHIENQFEDWMTWKNQGRYSFDAWDDSDPTTWKWQLDHIVPQSDLPYTSMEDDNFKKCWALENLRPLSAKQNHSDGVNKTRHKK